MKNKKLLLILSLFIGALQPIVWWAIYCGIGRSSFNCSGLDLCCSFSCVFFMAIFIALPIVSFLEGEK